MTFKKKKGRRVALHHPTRWNMEVILEFWTDEKIHVSHVVNVEFTQGILVIEYIEGFNHMQFLEYDFSAIRNFDVKKGA